VSRIEIGTVVLNIPDGVTRECVVSDFDGVSHEGVEVPAIVSGPGGLLLELAHRSWDGGGQVVMLSRGNSSPAFDRLLHGCRLGIRELDDGADVADVGLLRWDPNAGDQGWGNPSKASVADLDSVLGSSVETLLVHAGCYDFGERQSILRDTSRRKFWLCATFPSTEPETPLTAYVVSRVLPMVASIGGVA